MISNETLEAYAKLAYDTDRESEHTEALAEIASELLAIRNFRVEQTPEQKGRHIATLRRAIRNPDVLDSDLWWFAAPVAFPRIHWVPKQRNYIFS